ncbi:heavy-metal-associated domain-containing protein [Sandaracinobacteroides hominis]|uniref:heavy-metal-associated domain-containing protein n=1 Tax=Sandaracinobacteroides hominis TaxID=2780086 RepID=UPI0018F2DA34|nr:heavy metal-associated domain-containing protein [Sandaracinobacteroides hominis]
MKTMFIALLLVAAPLAAAPTPEAVTVKVNGLVCDFCARSIEAMMKKRPDVSGVHVDLDKGEVHLALKANATLDDPTLKKLITDSGYAVTGIERRASPAGREFQARPQ